MRRPARPRPPAGARQRALLAAALALATLSLAAHDSAAQCLLVRERGGLLYAPHLVVHFGDAAEVPRHVQCCTSLDKNLPTLCIPIYAYNLWEGADTFEFALRTPAPPVGFDRSPAITSVEMSVESDAQGTITNLKLAASAGLCGPVQLGCLRLPTGDLPASFQVTFTDHHGSGRRAARTTAGEWRQMVVDGGGALVGPGTASCSADPCGWHAPIQDLQASIGERAGMIDLAWTSGSGNFTLLRWRSDGRHPSDPWDGEFLALLPSSITRFTHVVSLPGDVRIAAWSISRGPFGNLYAASNVECGALASVLVQLPVGIEPRAWTQVKAMYR